MNHPNPGSDEAVARGCRCPVIDNGRGRGYMGQADIFVLSADCPLHWPPKEKEPKTKTINRKGKKT
jgi:hypothetical protein